MGVRRPSARAGAASMGKKERRFDSDALKGAQK
jgi:hypothetical protein